MPLGLWCADLLRCYQPARCHCEEQSNRRQRHHGYQVRLFIIRFSNVDQTIGSVIHFRPQLPNGVTFIILGQHVSLVSISYSIQTNSPCLSFTGSSQSSPVSGPARVDQLSAVTTNSHRRTVKLSEPSTSVFTRFGACAKALQPGYLV